MSENLKPLKQPKGANLTDEDIRILQMFCLKPWYSQFVNLYMTIRKLSKGKNSASEYRWDLLEYVDTIVLTKAIDSSSKKEDSVAELARINICGSDFGLHTTFSTQERVAFSQWLLRSLLVRPFVQV